jgi:DNA-binding NtrC family response regulator
MITMPTHVLVVDDETDFVEMLVLKLQATGLAVVAAYNGRECLERLQRNNIDVVLLDIKMPGMDGMDVLREIKRLHPLVEVVLLTGHGTIQTAVAGMKLGAFDYLLKPADFEDLQAKVAAAKQRKTAQEDRIRQAEAQSLLRESRKGGRSPFDL